MFYLYAFFHLCVRGEGINLIHQSVHSLCHTNDSNDQCTTSNNITQANSIWPFLTQACWSWLKPTQMSLPVLSLVNPAGREGGTIATFGATRGRIGLMLGTPVGALEAIWLLWQPRRSTTTWWAKRSLPGLGHLNWMERVRGHGQTTAYGTSILDGGTARRTMNKRGKKERKRINAWGFPTAARRNNKAGVMSPAPLKSSLSAAKGSAQVKTLWNEKQCQ